MREDIIEFLERDIKARCESPKNFFGMGVIIKERVSEN